MRSFRRLITGTLLAIFFSGVALARAPQELVDEARAASGVPGLAAAVISSSQLEVFASGQRRADQPELVETGDAFHIGSDMKAMVATLVAREIETGRLRWDSTVLEILPDVAIFARREYWRVTITQLLQHRAGIIPMLTLEDTYAVPKLRGSLIAQRVAFARWALRQKSVAPPGTVTEYSNAGYIVAAAMLERVTRKSVESLLERQLFTPLGITSARFDWPAARGRRDAPWGHVFTGEAFVPVDPDDPATRAPAWANPAGNLSLSTRDFAVFVRLHLQGLLGLTTYLDPTTFRRLHTPVDGYACGWGVFETGGLTISWHTGGTDLFYAVMLVAPQLDRAVVVVMNADNEALHEIAFTLAAQLLLEL